MRLPETNEEAWALAGLWGREREMNALEAFMWRAEEADPRMRSPVMSVEVMDRSPDWDRFMAAYEWGTRLIPRARMRVVDPPLGLGPPTWVVDPDFDLKYHLRRVRVAAPGTLREVLDLAAQIAMTPFDRRRPPWEAVIVEGMQGGQSASIFKMHHSVTDGQGGIQLMSMLHSRQREHSPDKPMPPPPAPERVSMRDLVTRQMMRRIATAPAEISRQAEQLLDNARHVAGDPAGSLNDALRYLDSLQRVVSPPPSPPSQLLRGRSLRWRFDTLEVGVDELKKPAKAAGGTLNDAYIAAVLAGFRLYHEAHNVPLAELPMAMPVSLRTTDHPMGGNRFAGARFAAPAGERDPGRRIKLIHEQILNVREEPAADAMNMLAPLLGRLPPRLVTGFYVEQSSRIDLQASNVAGLPYHVFNAGARIERVFPFGPLPGCAVMATLLSYAGVCCLGFNSDRAAITDGDLFAECLRRGLEEVLMLKPQPPPARGRASASGRGPARAASPQAAKGTAARRDSSRRRGAKASQSK